MQTAFHCTVLVLFNDNKVKSNLMTTVTVMVMMMTVIVMTWWW